MLTYIQVHLYYIIPPIAILGYLYAPLFGRRDAIKVGWLMFMATLWTTPWDNWIISHSAWTYPPDSILFKIGYVPIEEHLFFLFQPVLLILLQAVLGQDRLVPFLWRGLGSRSGQDKAGQAKAGQVKSKDKGEGEGQETVQTLRRRPGVALLWMTLAVIGFIGLFLPLPSLIQPFHSLSPSLSDLSTQILPLTLQKNNLFYLSSILIWISPVISLLTLLGARIELNSDKVTFVLGVGWLWCVDSVAIRAGAWSIGKEGTIGWEVWSGLPIEEALFFTLVSYLLIISSSLISHLHFILFLHPAPSQPRCPPLNPLSHILLLTRLAIHPPPLPIRTLEALERSERTLKRGSKSFSIAKLGWGREMRTGLVAVYGWCRITDDLIDEVEGEGEGEGEAGGKKERLRMMKDFLNLVYSPHPQQTLVDEFINTRVPRPAHSAFYLFSQLIPCMIPRTPFDDLLAGYETDLRFPPPPRSIALLAQGEKTGVTPIGTERDLIRYADRVAGSVADMILHLCWNILTSDPITPDTRWSLTAERKETLGMGRKMGQALQLVNIARDVRTDAQSMGRIYIPLSWFDERGREGENDLKGLLSDEEEVDMARYTLPLLNLANEYRLASTGSIARLPRTARAGTRAMVASYFEIGEEVSRRGGRIAGVREGRLRVSRWRRIWAILWSVWGWGG